MNHQPMLIEHGPKRAMRGTLPDDAIRQMIELGAIRSSAPFQATQVQPSTIDLTIGDVAFDVGHSFLPGDDGVAPKLMSAETRRMDLRRDNVIRPGATLLIPLREQLRLPAGISGISNAKSSTGRIDLFARMITENGIAFDCVPDGYRGPLYLELSPRSFPVTLRPGMRLNQLRFRVGESTDGYCLDDAAVATTHRATPLVDDELHLASGLVLSADMVGSGTGGIVAYEAEATKKPLSPDTPKIHRTSEFWRTIWAGDQGLTIRPGSFYLIATKELIQVPPGLAAEVVSVDPRWGSHQSHVAGLIDSGFGYTDGRRPGARLVLEIRTWDVPFKIKHGQPICRIQFEHMARTPSTLYGGGSNYQMQKGVTLSKIFF